MQNEEQTYEEWMKHCEQHFLNKNYTQVLFWGQRLLKHNICNCGFLHIMAAAHMHLNQFADAEKCIALIKQQDAEYIGAYIVEAYLHKKKKQFVTEFELLQWIIKEIERQQKEDPQIWKTSLAEAWSLLGSVLVILGLPEQASKAFFQASALEESRDQAVCEYSNALFTTNYIENIECKNMKLMHQRFNEFFTEDKVYPHYLRQKKVLRIGYISPDFRQHPVAFFSKALLQKFSSEKFEVYAYSLSLEDEVSAVLKTHVIWRNLCGVKKEEAAEVIYHDQIDILVDLSGHTKNNALPILAYKPAPVQISGIGYFNTTGLSTIKYFLSDTYCDSAVNDGDGEFSEELLRLPHSHFCYTPIMPMPDCPGQAPCAKNKYITFGSFNNFNKVTDALLLLWQQVLNAVPDSRMLLKSQLFDSEEGKQYTKERFQRLGISVQRFEFRGVTSAYLQEYAEIDIALDTYPYTGGVTTCEALYMGVPVITLAGNRHGSRFGYSLLINAGLSECIAFSSEEYIEKATLLAGDQQLLHGLRRNLRGILKKSDLMNEKQYVEEIEDAYRSVWEKELLLQAKSNLSSEFITKEIQKVWDYIYSGRFKEAEALSLYLLPSAKTGNGCRELWEILIGIYIERGNKEQAKKFLQTLQKNCPEYPYGLFLAARVHFLADEWDLAIETARRALHLGSKESMAVLSRIYNILGASYKNMGESSQSVICYKKEIELAETRDEMATAYSNYLFNLHYLPQYDGNQMFAEHKKYNIIFKDLIPYAHERKNRHEKIRIGYISPDLRYHVVVFFSYAFFQYYDRENFSVFCYAKCADDAVSRDIATKVDCWRNISGCDANEAAKIIYQDEIDILFDLSGHTKGSCLPVMAYKPAPVQISGIGYFDTTGLQAVDYFLADVYTDPGENDLVFTENLLRLPQSHFCYVPPDTMPNCPEHTPAEKNGYITFGSFNNFTKMTDEILSLWQKIMHDVPRSRLVLKSQIFGSASGKKHVEKRLKRLGFSMEHVDLRPETANYLEEYAEIDIALDTYPYPGGGTTCDALYMGVPVITLTGKRHGSRFGYSLLKNIGLENCCTFSREEYWQRAVSLANDREQLDEIHRSLRRRMQQSPLMQGKQYMQNLELLYHRVWEAFLQDLPVDRMELRQQTAKKIQTELEAAWKEKKWQRVVSLSKKRAAFAEKDAISICQNVWSLLQLDRLAEAQQLLDEVDDIWKDTGSILWMQGLCFYRQGKYYAAYKTFLIATLDEKNFIKDAVRKAFVFHKEFAEVSFLAGDIKTAHEEYRKSWQQSRSLEEKAQIYPFWLQTADFLSGNTSEIKKLYREAARTFCSEKKYPCIKKYHHSPIRIGYISADFCHSPEFYFYYQLLAEADQNRFALYCYNTGQMQDGYTSYCKNKADHWYDMPACSPQEIAEQMIRDEIDILMDLSGKSGEKAAAVMALQPACVQVSAFGSPSADLEKSVLKIEETGMEHPFCYTGRSDLPVSTNFSVRNQVCYTIGCFAPYPLWTDEVLEAWKKIFMINAEIKIQFFSMSFLDQEIVEQADCWLKNVGYPAEKISFQGLPQHDLLPVFLNLDLVLTAFSPDDSLFVCHSLYMGVPVVALCSARQKNQNVRKVLKSAGLEELVVDDVQEQQEKIRAIMADENFLRAFQKKSRQILLESPLMDGKKYVRQVENWYQWIVKQETMD